MPITLEEFQGRLLESGVISAEELERFFVPWPQERRPKTAQQLAAALCRAGLLTVYQANQIAKGEGRRLLLGEYLILDRLGGGGMGEVFKARHRTMDRIVALKVIKPSDRGRLVLHWPKADRQDAKLDLDGVFMDMEKLADPRNPDQLSLLLPAGEHTIWLARRGFEPIEHTLTIPPGQEVSFQPQWRKASAAPVEPLKPEPKPEQPGGQKPAQPPGTKPEETPGGKPEEKPSHPGEKPPTKPEPAPPGRPALLLAWEKLESQLGQWEAQEAQFNQKVQPIEELASQWQFAQAAEQAKTVPFAEPELQRRWLLRQQELRWLAEWKERLIQKIRRSDKPVLKSQLGARGVEGEVVELDDQKITFPLSGGRTETLAWNDLGPRAPRKLVGLVIDQQKPDDLLKAAVFLASVGQAADATRYFSQAQKAGLAVQEHLELASYPLIVEMVGQLRKKEYSSAQAAFQRLEAEEALAPWRAQHKELLDSIRTVLSEAQREAEAEKLYAEAVKLYKEQELHDVKPLVQRLQKEYADTTAVLDAARQPPVAELEKATAQLGRRISVRKDGKGDFTSIQAAIDAAEAGNCIVIEDSGVYNERVVIPRQKERLTIRGARGQWPLITSWGKNRDFESLILIQAPRTTIERIIAFHATPVGREPCCLFVAPPRSSVRLQLAFLSQAPPGAALHTVGHDRDLVEVRYSVLLGQERVGIGRFPGGSLEDTVVVLRSGNLYFGAQIAVRHCVLLANLRSEYSGYVFIDSILFSLNGMNLSNRFENCDILKGYQAGMGVRCFSADPMFRDPANLDFRLRPGSPCIGKASDGGDIGVRWTPEMLEMINVALELRRRGLIKF